MKRLFQRLIFVLFWQALFFLSIFYVSDKFYAQWTIGFILFFFLIMIISFRVIPGQARIDRLINLSREFKLKQEEEAAVRQAALQLELKCPNCEKSNNYWAYLQDYRCEKCGSGLWSTDIKKRPKDYQDLFLRRDTVKQYMDGLSAGMKRQLKKQLLDQE